MCGILTTGSLFSSVAGKAPFLSPLSDLSLSLGANVSRGVGQLLAQR